MNSKNKKIMSVVLMLLMVFTTIGAAVAAGESNITSENDCGDRITKNVTNLNGTNDTINYMDTINYTIEVTNDHILPYEFRVNDTLPEELEFVSYTATQGTYDNNTGIWDIGWLVGYPHHQTATLTIISKVIKACTTVNNTAQLQLKLWVPFIGSFWIDDGKASVKFDVPCAADLGITKCVNDTNPNYLDYVNFTINAANNGPSDATGVSINDLLPAGLQFVSYTATQGTYNEATGVWDIGELNAYCQAVINIIARVTESCTCIINTANISGCEYDPCLDNNAASSTINVPCAADLGITKTVNNTDPKLNDTINFTINATNNGPDDATGVTVTDLLPAGLQWISDDSSGAYNSATGVWTIGNLANGASTLLNIIAKVITSNANITNVANVTGCEYDPCLDNNSANTTVNVPAQSSLYITITSPTTCVGLNTIQQIIFKVGNNGPDTANNVNMTWVIPEGMEFVNATVDVGTFEYIAATRTLIWYLGDVPVGDPYMWLFVKVLKEGNYLINPALTTTTYDPTLGTSVEFRDLCVKAATNVIPSDNTVPMQKTGMPLGMIVLAIMAVLGGVIIQRRKK